MSRSVTLVLSKIVGSTKQPDTSRAVTVRDLDGNTIATATESPAGSGKYVASWTETNKYGYWYVDGVKKSDVDVTSPFYLGLSGSISATSISSTTLTATTISGGAFIFNNANINTAGTLTNVAYQNQDNTFASGQTISKKSTPFLKIEEVNSGNYMVLSASDSDMMIKTIGADLHLCASVSAIGALSANKFYGDGSALVNLPTAGGAVPYNGAVSDVDLGLYSLSGYALTSGTSIIFPSGANRNVKVNPRAVGVGYGLTIEAGGAGDDEGGDLNLYAGYGTGNPAGDVNISGASIWLNGVVTSPSLSGTTVSMGTISAHTGSATNLWVQSITAIAAGNGGISGTITATQFYNRVGTLTDSASISVDPRIAHFWRVVLGGNRQLANPSPNPMDGTKLIFGVEQPAASGPYTLTFDTKYRFGATVTGFSTQSTAANKVDYITCFYHAADDKWDVLAIAAGY